MKEIYTEKDILESLRDLPLDKKRQVSDFIEFLKSRYTQNTHRRVKGLWRDFQIDITPEDLTRARQDMWSSFPREFE